MTRPLISTLCLTALLLILAAPSPAAPATSPATQPTVRVAAIGPVNELDFWPTLAARFEKATGIRVETVLTGNKDAAPDAFHRGNIDLITLASADALTSLAADGYARDLQPWAQVELILVGPRTDPAAVRDSKDLATALSKILAGNHPLVVHASLGADQVVRTAVQSTKGQSLDGRATVLLSDHQKQVLQVAIDKHAYTLIAATPFRTGKLPTGDLVELLHGDAALRRPILLATADPRRIPGAHTAEAHRLAAFVQSEDTQNWIANYRPANAPKDSPQPFFPLSRERVATPTPAKSLLRITGDTLDHPLDITPELWAKLPRSTATLPARNNAPAVTYSGVLLRDVLRAADIPMGNHTLAGPWLDRAAHVGSSDGFRAVFALSELDPDIGASNALLADRRDDHDLLPQEGTLRLLVPSDHRPTRWVKNVSTVEIR